MKRLCIFLAALLFAGAMCFGNGITPVAAETAGIYGEIERYFDRTVKNAHIPAASVIIVDRDSTLFSKQYGVDDSPFLLGSVSKSFTAACIMQLVEAGKVKLDDPVSAYLPAAREGDRITVKQLLNHTSGLGEHDSLENYRIAGTQGKHVYANVNFSLLGKIVEVASGERYKNYVKEHIFQPLGMTKSAATKEESEQNGLVQGTRNYFGISVNAAPRYPKGEGDWISVPAGYLSSSASDLGKYLQAYLNDGGKILTKESVNAMFYDGVRVEASIPYSYGFGWTLMEDTLKEPVLRHSGWVETGMSCVYILPQSGIAAAVLVNTNDFFVTKDMMDRMDWSIPLLLLGEQPNEIGESEYVLKHLGFDLVYFVVLVLSLLPFFFLKRYLVPASGKRLCKRIIIILLLHVICPALLLALPYFLNVPLWVVYAFVPDFFLVEVISAALLFFGGVYKAAFMLFSKCNHKEI